MKANLVTYVEIRLDEAESAAMMKDITRALEVVDLDTLRMFRAVHSEAIRSGHADSEKMEK